MADIIRFNTDPHRITQKLLPWFAMGTLDADETLAVESHLEGCAECRAELETERALGAMIATVPSDVERGWDALRSRIESEKPRRRSTGLWRGTGAARPRPAASGWTTTAMPPMGWAITAQAASLVLIAGVAWVWANGQHIQQYHALSAPKAVNTGNLVVIFKPTTSEQDLRGALRRADARLVDGPTASDAYVLHVASAERMAALGKLRANTEVVLAEPIDGDVRP